jgi:hypothetical protein
MIGPLGVSARQEASTTAGDARWSAVGGRITIR